MNEYVGHDDQVMSVYRGTFTEGKARGVRFVYVNNGSGLEATVLLDRCLDIYQVRFDGRNCGFINPCGVVHPSYYSHSDEGWIDTFTAGFLTTCGLTYTGLGVEDDGLRTTLHGVIGNMPVAWSSIVRESIGGVPQVKISGEVHENLDGRNMCLRRELTICHRKNEIALRDVVVNRAFEPAPHMIVYHCNLGYPLLSEKAEIVLQSRGVRGRTTWAQQNLKTWNKILPPQENFEEMCFYHDVAKDERGFARAGLKNSAEGIGLEVEYDTHTLDQFVQWNMFKRGEYVLGIEPCNATIDGRADARNNGTLKYLDPGESSEHKVTFRFFRVS